MQQCGPYDQDIPSGTSHLGHPIWDKRQRTRTGRGPRDRFQRNGRGPDAGVAVSLCGPRTICRAPVVRCRAGAAAAARSIVGDAARRRRRRRGASPTQNPRNRREPGFAGTGRLLFIWREGHGPARLWERLDPGLPKNACWRMASPTGKPAGQPNRNTGWPAQQEHRLASPTGTPAGQPNRNTGW
eukprot:gene16583-biopygen23283